MRRIRIWLGAAGLIAASVIVSVAYSQIRLGRLKEYSIPTVRVHKEQVVLMVYADGEVRAPKSQIITGPPVNGTLQIEWIAKPGTIVKAGDIILKFDPSEQQYNLEQSESQLQEAEQQILKAKADAEVSAAQDQVALLKARFDVRRAVLEVGKNELVGDIDARKNELALSEAKRKLAQMQKDIESREVSNEAGIAVLQQKSAQAKLSMEQARHAIETMQVKAPIDGVVRVKDNMDANGGMLYPGVQLPAYRAGDQVYPGRPVAEVLDMGNLQIMAKISERDRAHVSPGQEVRVHFDASPEKDLTARVKTLADVAGHDFWSSESSRKFEAGFELTEKNVSISPGVSALVSIIGSSAQSAFHLPRQSVFRKDGNTLVYVRQGKEFRPQAIKVVEQSDTQVVVDGISEGTEVALVDPTEPQKKTRQSSDSPLGGAR